MSWRRSTRRTGRKQKPEGRGPSISTSDAPASARAGRNSLNALKEQFATRFVNSKESIDKDALKSANLADAEMEALGVKITQKEEFFFETYPEKAELAA